MAPIDTQLPQLEIQASFHRQCYCLVTFKNGIHKANIPNRNYQAHHCPYSFQEIKILINKYILALFPPLETEAFSSGHNSSSTEAKHKCQLLIFQQNFPTVVDTALLLSSSLAKCTEPEEVRSKVSSLLCLSYPSQSSDNPHQDATTLVAEPLGNSFQSSFTVYIKNSSITYRT